MYRQIIVPENTKLILQLPSEFVGHQIEVIAFPVENEEAVTVTNKKWTKKKTDKELDDFYNTIRIDMTHYKFNRQRANER
ncbi:MAG: hypothetical protein AABZ32_00955 [Bacteroidota bacterium]